MDRILAKTRLAGFLDSLLGTHDVIAPVHAGRGSLFRPIRRGAEVCLDFLKPMKSAKEIFFPQNEDLFYYNTHTQRAVEAPAPPRPTVVFGLRPCDLQGIAAQDRIFSAAPVKDSYYMRRRENAILIGLGCPEMESACFCHLLGIDRMDSAVADLFFVPLDDAYFIRVQTERGEQLVSSLAAADDAAREERRRCAEASAAATAPQGGQAEPISIEALRAALAESFEDPVWEEVARKCLGCAACTFVCPTCHCFDITDETRRDLGRRVRTWDGCMFPKFTLHTSGHNPRTIGRQRMRQRILHKFSYFPENQGMISCTGCGRCIEVCPVNLDLREVLLRLLALTRQPR